MRNVILAILFGLLYAATAAASPREGASRDTSPILLSQNTFGDTLGGILSIFTGRDEQLTEFEPNNSPDQATAIRLNENAAGLIHLGDYDKGDYYTFTPANSGTVTVTLSGFPGECRMTIAAYGFQRDTRAPVRPEPSKTSIKGESSLTFSFPVTANYPGFIAVSGPVIEGGSFSGQNWSASQCTRKGDYYLHPQAGENPKDVPRSFNSRKILAPIQYQLTATLREGAERAEPLEQVPASKWGEYIRTGESFIVIFDKAGFDDAGWTGANDPMGSIKAGETYTVKYDPYLGWTATGLNEKTGTSATSSHQKGDPGEGELNIWGRIYRFSANGEIFDPEFGLVGRLAKSSDAAKKETAPRTDQTFGLPKGVTIENKRTYAPSRSFEPEDNLIHVFFTYKGLTPGAKMKTVWYFLDNPEQPYKIGESEQTVVRESAGYADFQYELAKDKKWPNGRYRIDVMLDNTKIDEIMFRVRDRK
ncbi:MAG: hypothetical protein OHK006_14390 [Thermodesulfovibrionales bacterium]